LTLSSATGNTYSGGTTVNGGALYVINNPYPTSATGPGNVVVGGSGTLAGNGRSIRLVATW